MTMAVAVDVDVDVVKISNLIAIHAYYTRAMACFLQKFDIKQREAG